MVEFDFVEGLQPLSAEERVNRREENNDKRRRSGKDTSEERSPKRSHKRDMSSRSPTPKKKSSRRRSRIKSPDKVLTAAWALKKAAAEYAKLTRL